MSQANDRYTATRLSAELGLDNRKVRDVLTRVNPIAVEGQRKYYLLRDVIPHVAKHLGAPEVIDLNAERARKVKAEAALAEIELEKERGSLVDVDAAQATWTEMVRAAAQRVQTLPAKLAPVLAVEEEPAVVKALLDEAINETLNELADYIADWADEEPVEELAEDSGESMEAAAEADSQPMGGHNETIKPGS